MITVHQLYLAVSYVIDLIVDVVAGTLHTVEFHYLFTVYFTTVLAYTNHSR